LLCRAHRPPVGRASTLPAAGCWSARPRSLVMVVCLGYRANGATSTSGQAGSGGMALRSGTAVWAVTATAITSAATTAAIRFMAALLWGACWGTRMNDAKPRAREIGRSGRHTSGVSPGHARQARHDRPRWYARRVRSHERAGSVRFGVAGCRWTRRGVRGGRRRPSLRRGGSGAGGGPHRLHWPECPDVLPAILIPAVFLHRSQCRPSRAAHRPGPAARSSIRGRGSICCSLKCARLSGCCPFYPCSARRVGASPSFASPSSTGAGKEAGARALALHHRV
jgi:hypothetical protein